jgi:hypothetical protein
MGKKMKKLFRILLKIILILIIIILIGGLSYVWYSFNHYSPADPAVETDNSKQIYFQNSYNACRAAFTNQARLLSDRMDSAEIFSKTVASEIDNDLTIDFCYIPASSEKSNLFILTSGAHGVEGYVGSAIQQMFMNEIVRPEMCKKTGVLLIHGLNPYGFKYTRRVTENNVDFNRNCDTDKTLFSSENNGYDKLYGMLNPQGKADRSSLKNQFFMVVAINKLLQESMQSLRQAVLQGQYKHPSGLYFGGKDYELQLEDIKSVIKEKSTDYKNVFCIDLHTGYGERGTLHLFPNPIKDPKVKQGLETVFEGYTIDWGDSKDFYVINGSFVDFLADLLPGKFYMPMVFEYGSLNSQTTIGSVKSLHNMILENQGYHNGYNSVDDSLKVKNTFMEMYNPSSEAWRSKVMNDSRLMLEKVIDRYGKM